ncbi:hypothetical protein IIV30_048L [Invertebrate iridescent virus 30]|uniref:Uncharacterized protein n=1 Tax=Invertebrate iridescent virus 30 TaxID=345585 RepID=W8W1Q5_9VIRU|nr:hypothetical protein IIV30_048L [Invertebrate iridescent virus 30]CCV02243.1 hypothetical protein IIV30_048L [Invertebrate iridescent virus 30]
MGNTSSDKKYDNNTKLDQNECDHGYNKEELGEYAFLKSDRLNNIHYKNNYNEALAGERPSSANVVGVVQDVLTVRNEPLKIADACNECEKKVVKFDHTDNNCSDKVLNYPKSNIRELNNDLGSGRWQHRP